MKKKLMLIQPQKYNELFSTYHNPKKTKNYLPTIPSNLQKELEITAYTSRTNTLTKNNFNNRASFSSNKKSYIIKRNNDFYSSLMTHQNSQENFKKNEFLPFPSLIQQYKIIDEKSKTKKKFEIKKSNFNIIYLNLSNPANKLIQKEYSVEQIDKNEFVNKKIEEINNLKKQKIKEIFNKNEKTKIKKDLSSLNNIPIVILNLFAEDIYNNLNGKNNQDNQEKLNSNNFNKSKKLNSIKDSTRNLLNLDSINKTIYKNNTFFQFILNNVKRKIEIINDSNKSISILYVMNLINNELSDLRKNIEDYLIENNQLTSNNVSKISNYEITPSNTFRFKTNNSKIKINENNSSGVLGNLIKNQIYSKKNDGSKKIFFENNINNKKNKENTIFQNKEIIFSINQKETKGKTDVKTIKKINIPKKIKNLNNKNKPLELGTSSEKEKFLTSRYYFNTSPDKIQSKQKFFHKVKEEQKIPRSFSEVFLKKNYPKASDCINEISNTIEKKFLIKKIKEKEKLKKNQFTNTYTNTNDNNKYVPKNFKKNKYNKLNEEYPEQDNKDNNKFIKFKKGKDEEDNDYDFIQEKYIITPKKSQEIFQILSGDQEKRIKIKNQELKNNYENIVINMESIKQEESKLSLTPQKTEFLEKKLKTDPSSSIYDGQQSSENQEPNLIYFDKNKKKEIIYENAIQEIQEKKRHKKKKNKRKKNQDLSNIKSSKTSENNIFRKSINKNFSNTNGNDNDNGNEIIINHNKRTKKKKRKNKEKKLEAIINLINNNPNIKNKEELIQKFINSNERKDEESSEEEENEDENYEDEDEEEEEEEENEEEIKYTKNINEKNKSQKNENNNLEKEKRQKKKQKKAEKVLEEDLNDNKNNRKNKKLMISSKNNPKEKTKYSDNQKSTKEVIKRNKELSIESINSTKTKMKEPFNKKYKNEFEEEQDIINKTKKSEKNFNMDKNKKMINEINHPSDESIEENSEYQDSIKEMDKHNASNKNDLYNKKQLSKEKNDKAKKGDDNQKIISDTSFLLFDDNLNEIIKKNIPPNNINLKNYNKQEELKILNEVMELDNLTESEKNYVLSEMINLRNIIIKSKEINKEIKNQINIKRIALYKLINQYFINSILEDIKNDAVKKDKYSKKLKKLEKIQNFGIFTYKNLSILETKYVLPFLNEEERKKLELEEKENKKLREKIALEEFENYKKYRERKKKNTQLIYDNSYLFRKEKIKKKDYKLRKEVEDILNKEYEEFQSHQNVRRNSRLMSLITKRKKLETKKKISKNKRNSLKLKNFKMQEEINEEVDDSKRLKELEEQKLEEEKDRKLKNFFERIRKLKNGEFQNFDEELNQLIIEIMDKKDVISKNKENRMNSFIQNFQYNRMKDKSKSKYNNRGFNFVSPIRFISEYQK